MSFGKSNQSSNQEMDPQIKGALLDVYNTGRGLSRTPYNPYNFATVAPMSPFQQQGMQATLDAARGGVGQEQVNQAIQAAEGVAGYTPKKATFRGVTEQGNIADVSGGSASGLERASANAIPTSFTGTRALVNNINTGVDAGDVRAANANETYRQMGINVGDVNTGIGFTDVGAGTITDPGKVAARKSASQNIGSLGLLGPGVTAESASQIGPNTPRVKQRKVEYKDVVGPEGAVSVGPIDPSTVTSGTVSASTIDPLSFQESRVNDYMNQYQTGVIDSALGDIERARKMQQNQNAAGAISAGAFGGDRAAIVEAETNRAALEQSAETASQLRAQGFESAARLAEADLARRMDAATANQQAGLQGQLANQQTGLEASQANAQLGLQGQTEAARL